MLPLGAGLGSSAAYSVCVATALLVHFGHISPFREQSEVKEGQLSETVNKWAFKAEQVIHGNPSGIDNAVSTFGESLFFVRFYISP